MKDARLGEFEEIILLLVGILEDKAYTLRIAEEFETQTGKSVSIGATHSTLDRLCKKGLLKSELSEPTAVRGGRRKRIFSISASGERALLASRDLRTSLWDQYPAFSKLSLNI
ncbi:PadR family transcriptional regulator [Poritiphilus flavus]|uniref:PadR family transcriptional regulator n=1 Tax=Poritiphilus flavus TaxID=2697053 RepID=A0A6L9EAK5_9FLAO|nr:PadR family transcriptional regulator [Poritiphilus flavus]NAS11740.1 PadR family transcriptional regulator [Poritiphilus flavus]